MSDEIIKQFVSYFRGRGDAYGNAKGFCVKEALTEGVFARHLTSSDPADQIGVYCMIKELCSWGCIDIDGKDFPVTKLNPEWPNVGNYDPQYIVQHDWDRMWELACNLRIVLEVAGVPAHIERSKNGYHVWVFPTEPLVSAATMRRALMAVCAAIDYDPKEVNPKAEGPRPGTKGYGNFVRLPYGGALGDSWEPTQRYMVGPVHGEPASLEAWLGSRPERAYTVHLEELAKLWTPPVVEFSVNFDHVELDEQLLKSLDGLSYSIWKDGPLEGSDRSSTLARLAHKLRDNGNTPSEAMAVLRSADVRWGGKFASRADGEFQLQRMVENAYGVQKM